MKLHRHSAQNLTFKYVTLTSSGLEEWAVKCFHISREQQLWLQSVSGLYTKAKVKQLHMCEKEQGWSYHSFWGKKTNKTTGLVDVCWKQHKERIQLPQLNDWDNRWMMMSSLQGHVPETHKLKSQRKPLLLFGCCNGKVSMSFVPLSLNYNTITWCAKVRCLWLVYSTLSTWAVFFLSNDLQHFHGCITVPFPINIWQNNIDTTYRQFLKDFCH